MAGAIALGITLLTAPTASIADDLPATTTITQGECSTLAGTVIDPGTIGLPTNGATVTSAAWDAAGFCAVRGSIAPVSDGQPINFQVNLPASWNKKALQFGGGGYNGSLVQATGRYSLQPASGTPPILDGYVTLGSDGGSGGGEDKGMSDETRRNYGKESIKKTHDVAIALVDAAYHSSPERFYFSGQSQGGHEALDAAARYPDDYDGVLAHYPAHNVTMLHIGIVNLRDAARANGGSGHIGATEAALITNSVISTCDPLDGATDQIVSDPNGCHDAFDIDSLRCASGGDEGDACLSDVQIATALKIANDYDLGYEVAGNRYYAGWPLLDGSPFAGGNGTVDVPREWSFLVRTSKYLVTRDPNLNVDTFNPLDWQEEVVAAGKDMDVTDVDLQPFFDKGGKIIMLHGTADELISHHMSLQYFERQVAKFGVDRLSDSMKFYLIPALGHGTGSFAARYEGLPALEGWVEGGKEPTGLVAEAGTRSRPMCEYGTFPKFVEGDPNLAASFTCAPATGSPPEFSSGPADVVVAPTQGDSVATFSVSVENAQPSMVWWQMRRAGSSEWAVVPGSSPGTTLMYSYSEADSGTEFRATAANDAYRVESDSAVLTVTEAPPVNVGAPSISGAPDVRSTLTASNGEWTGSDLVYTYRWLRDGNPIPQATAAQYRLTPADQGKTVTVEVTATGPGGSAVAASADVLVRFQSSVLVTTSPLLVATSAKKVAVNVRVFPGAADGPVTVTVAGKTLDGSLTGGRVTLDAGKLPRGVHVITANYGGNTVTSPSLGYGLIIVLR